jgi:hypothetical protein
MSRVAYSSDVSVLTGVLDDHCRNRGILDPAQREQIAARLFSFFNDGVTTSEDLMRALELDLFRRARLKATDLPELK